jgi:hypothetical protein
MQPKHTAQPAESIVQRLQHRIEQARQLGFVVRHEWLDGLESSWCELGGVKLLFLDVSKNSAEQLEQVNGAIAWRQEQIAAARSDAAPAQRAA